MVPGNMRSIQREGWIPIEEAQRGHGWIRVAQPMAQPVAQPVAKPVAQPVPQRRVLLDEDDQIFSSQM
ncbi:hypothetical protein ACLKA7_011689 [Drosophila subpalustris]